MGLADEVRRRIDQGELPSARPEKLYSRYGDGSPCSACGAAVHSAQIRYLFELDDAAYQFHIGCFGLWEAELRRRGPAAEETVTQRLKAVLRHIAPAGQCFPCLSAKLSVPTKEILDSAQLLVLDPSIRVHQGACLACERWERVIRFMPPRRSESTAGEASG
jgi:hypothetical protein